MYAPILGAIGLFVYHWNGNSVEWPEALVLGIFALCVFIIRMDEKYR